jgi:hypothetical protein
MSQPADSDLEAFLARIYTDARALARFLEDPRAEAVRAGLSAQDVRALVDLDPVHLQLAADSFAHKRRASRGPR